jgi:hypothetical protein
MIKIITIDREYGSGAADMPHLRRGLLGNCGARCRLLLGPAVDEREERGDALHYSLFKAFLRGSFEGTLNVQRGKMVDAECIREASEKVVREAAGQGNSVLVGRGSAYYLQPNPDAFHVFVYAPF